jgi:hypothetical protein
MGHEGVKPASVSQTFRHGDIDGDGLIEPEQNEEDRDRTGRRGEKKDGARGKFMR